MLWKLIHFPLKLNFFLKLMSLFTYFKKYGNYNTKRKKTQVCTETYSRLTIGFSWCFNSNTQKNTPDTKTLQQIYSNSFAREEKGTDFKGMTVIIKNMVNGGSAKK